MGWLNLFLADLTAVGSSGLGSASLSVAGIMVEVSGLLQHAFWVTEMPQITLPPAAVLGFYQTRSFGTG